VEDYIGDIPKYQDKAKKVAFAPNEQDQANDEPMGVEFTGYSQPEPDQQVSKAETLASMGL
jgi:hypothetical protein